MFIIFFFISHVHAAAMTLPELVDKALENNPTTKKAWWNAKRAISAKKSAENAYLPTLGLKADVTRGKEYKFINGPDTYFTELQANVIFSMLLFDFGERKAEIEATRFALEAAGWLSDQAIQAVMKDVLDGAYRLLEAEENYRALNESLKDARKVLHIAEERNQTGARPLSDVLLARTTLLDLELELASLESLIAINRGKLAILVGLAPSSPLEIASIEIASLPESTETQDFEIGKIASKTRADLLAQKAKTSELLAKMEKEAASFLPKLRLNGAVGPSAYVHDHTDDLPYSVNLELKAELFHGFDSIYRKHMAYTDVNVSIEEQAELELEIAQEIFEQNRTLSATQEILKFAKERLKNAESAYQATVEKYTSGYKIEYSEVFYATQELAKARIALSQAKIASHLSRAKLAYSLGTIAAYVKST